jgi:hypothetical protein
MFCISFHIAPEHSRRFDQNLFLQKVKSIRPPEVDAYEEKKQLHLSFHFFTEFPSDLWAKLQTALFGELPNQSEYSRMLSAICIVTCEGENEEDYWLLHHFDKKEKIDQLPSNLK